MLNLNNFNTILCLQPYMIGLFGSIYIYLRLNFYSVKNFLTKFEASNFKNNLTNFTPLITFVTALLLVLLLITCNSSNTIIGFNSNPIIVLLLVCYLFILNNHNNHNSHWLFGSFFSIIFSLLLLNSSSIFNFFFLLEVNTYLFLYLSISQVQSTTNNQNQSIINAVLVAFIINFFSSICIFSSIFYLLYLNGSEVFFCDTSLSNLFFMFFALKLLSGPWVYFGVEVYKGFKYLTLLVYTLIFTFVLVPKMFYFLIHFNVTIGLNFFLPIFLYTFVILIGTRGVNSVKIFLAYSTSFNFIYILVFFLMINYNVN